MKAKYGAHIYSDLNYSENVKQNFEKRTGLNHLFTDHTLNNKPVLQTSDQISIFITKSADNHPIEENLIKSSKSIFLQRDLEKDDKDV